MKALGNRVALGNESDLITPTLAQNYPLGIEIPVEDSATKTVKKFLYVKANGVLTAYVPYTVDFTYTAGAEVTTKTPVALAAPGALIAVPQVAFTSGYYGFVQIYGDAKCNCAATPTSGNTLTVASGTPTVMTDESGTTVLVSTVAISKGILTTANPVWLLGRQAVLS